MSDGEEEEDSRNVDTRVTYHGKSVLKIHVKSKQERKLNAYTAIDGETSKSGTMTVNGDRYGKNEGYRIYADYEPEANVTITDLTFRVWIDGTLKHESTPVIEPDERVYINFRADMGLKVGKDSAVTALQQGKKAQNGSYPTP